MTTIGGIDFGAQGFGAMALSEVYGAVEPDAALATLHHGLDAGIRHIDTADIYGAGRNEELIGRVLATRRDEVVLASKVGFVRDPQPGGPRFRGDRDHIRAAIHASLTRLGTDHLDLYYLHRVDPATPIEESVAALAELVAEGLVRQIGLSEVTARELERAHAVHPIAAVQSEWSVWSRDTEDAVVPTAARLGVGVVAYAPLGRGFLAAPAPLDLAGDDLRRNFPRFDPDRLAANAPIGEVVRSVAAAEGVTPAQVALAWLQAKAAALGVQAIAIPSTRRPERVDENLAATRIRLSDAALAALEPLGAQVAGDRARTVTDIAQGRERAERGA